MDKIITIDDYLAVKTSIYDVIKSYTIFYINQYKSKAEKNVTYGSYTYSKIIYAEEKSNAAKFLFHNDAEKTIFINNIMHENDEKFMDLINKAEAYDVLYNFIYEINKINKNEDNNKKRVLMSMYVNSYLNKHKEIFKNLENTFCNYKLRKNEYRLSNIINKFTEIYVFNQSLFNSINGYEEEKVYTK